MNKKPEEKYTDPELRERLKEEIMQSDKGGEPGHWSARKSQLLVREYEALVVSTRSLSCAAWMPLSMKACSSLRFSVSSSGVCSSSSSSSPPSVDFFSLGGVDVRGMEKSNSERSGRGKYGY